MPSQIKDLPLEVLQLIFLHVPHSKYASFRRVNSRWNSLLRVYVFKRININVETTISDLLADLERSRYQTPSNTVTPIGHLITTVNMHIEELFTGSALKRFACLCPNVTDLSANYGLLSTIDSDDGGYSAALEDPYSCHLTEGSLDDIESPNLSFVFGSWDLTKLVLRDVYCFSLLVMVILPPLRNLVHLEIYTDDSYLDMINGDDAIVDRSNLMEYIHDCCPQLQHLRLPKGYLNTVEQKFNLESLQLQSLSDLQTTFTFWSASICPWPSLTSLTLNIAFSYGPTQHHWASPILIYLAIKFPNLQHLTLTSPYNRIRQVFDLPTTPGHQRISTALLSNKYIFTKLKSLRINGIPLDYVAKLILFNRHSSIESSTSTLKDLNIDHCIGSHTTEYSIYHQNDFFQQSIFNHSITTLHLRDNGINFNDMLQCLNPSLNTIETLSLGMGHKKQGTISINLILDQCPRLKNLRLSTLYLTQSSTETTQHPMETLELKQIKLETTDVFTLVSKRCRHLTKLSFNNLRITASTPPTNDGWTKHYGTKLLEQNGSLLKSTNVTWISMPHTQLDSCSLQQLCRVGPRFDYTHASYLLIRVSPAAVDGSLSKPSILLYSMRRPDPYKHMLACYDGDTTMDILDKLSCGRGTLDIDAENCFMTIKKKGLVIFYCQDVKNWNPI